jgi:hypothetical protein
MSKASFVRSTFVALAALTALLGVEPLSSESVTIATTYPAPSGVYTNMITTGNTWLARDGGAVGVGTPNPLATLDVRGSVKFRDPADAAPQSGWVMTSLDGAGNAGWRPGPGGRAFHASDSAGRVVGATPTTIASVSIAPASVASRYLIIASPVLGNGTASGNTFAGIFRGSTQLVQFTSIEQSQHDAIATTGTWFDAPATTDTVVYSLRVWANSTGYANRSQNGGFTATSTLAVIEFN